MGDTPIFRRVKSPTGESQERVEPSALFPVRLLLLLGSLCLDSDRGNRLAECLVSRSHGVVSRTRKAGGAVVVDSLDAMLRMRSGSG